MITTDINWGTSPLFLVFAEFKVCTRWDIRTLCVEDGFVWKLCELVDIMQYLRTSFFVNSVNSPKFCTTFYPSMISFFFLFEFWFKFKFFSSTKYFSLSFWVSLLNRSLWLDRPFGSIVHDALNFIYCSAAPKPQKIDRVSEETAISIASRAVNR